jgi:hypothetical protein
MHILLININPVVSRLVSLCAREEHINLEEVHSIDAVTHDRYDIVFVDDASYNDEIKELLASLIIREKVFLSSKDEMSNETSVFDTIITKPFLPSQIIMVMESLEEEETLEPTIEIPSIFPLSSDDEESVDETPKEDIEEGTKVLDTNEIEKIKALLEMEEETEEVNEVEYESRKREVITQQLISDGLEIIDEDEYVEILSKKPSKKKKSKKTKSRKNEDKKKKEKIFTFEEALLAAIEGMKVKKIKKLLKDAEVTIKINFKDKK